MKKIGGYILLGLGLSLSLGSAWSWWYYKDALHYPGSSFTEIRQLIEPHMQVLLPQGDGPFPTALLLHGCGGVDEFSVPRAQPLVDRGFAVIIVDSNNPRSLHWTMTCDGRALLGNQRAADVLVALEYARSLPEVDPQALFLVGFSHGSWTALEALYFGDDLPPGLTDSPGHHFDGVRGIVAWYPYCGFITEFRRGWSSDIPVLMLLADEDEITDPRPCETVARQQAAAGHPVSYITYPAISHGFDMNDDWVISYDPATAERASAAQVEFLSSLIQ